MIVDAPGTFFYKKLLRLPASASNVGTHWYLSREAVNISQEAEATLRALLFWFKLQTTDGDRLLKKCYVLQCAEMQRGISCWASKIKLTLESLGMQDDWLNASGNIRSFQARCTEKLSRVEYDRLSDRAKLFPSLNVLRVVKSLTGRGAPIICPSIQANPERHGWIIMTLLSCPGSLVKRLEGVTSCALCGEPVSCIFSHILAICIKIPSRIKRFQQKQFLARLIQDLKSDPESATSTLIYQLFMSELRFRIQREYAEMFYWLRCA